MEHGFEHLRGLEDLWKMALVNNKYLTDDSIEVLSKYTKVSVKYCDDTRSCSDTWYFSISVSGQTEVAASGQQWQHY